MKHMVLFFIDYFESKFNKDICFENILNWSKWSSVILLVKKDKGPKSVSGSYIFCVLTYMMDSMRWSLRVPCKYMHCIYGTECWFWHFLVCGDKDQNIFTQFEQNITTSSAGPSAPPQSCPTLIVSWSGSLFVLSSTSNENKRKDSTGERLLWVSQWKPRRGVRRISVCECVSNNTTSVLKVNKTPQK